MLLSLLLWIFPFACGAKDHHAQARAIFERYAAMEMAFDANIADLYADQALISNKRSYPHGLIREVTVPAPKYKEMIRDAMPLAKLKGDYSTYSEATFTTEGKGVRLHAKRYSVLKKYTSNLSILFAPDASGRWLIWEELSESRPF